MTHTLSYFSSVLFSSLILPSFFLSSSTALTSPNHSCKTVIISFWNSNYTLCLAPAIGDGNPNAVASPACWTCYLVASSSTNASFVRCCFTNWDTLCLQCISYVLSMGVCAPWPWVCVRLNLDVWTPSGLVYLLLLVVMLLRDLRSMVLMLELRCCQYCN